MAIVSTQSIYVSGVMPLELCIPWSEEAENMFIELTKAINTLQHRVAGVLKNSESIKSFLISDQKLLG